MIGHFDLGSIPARVRNVNSGFYFVIHHGAIGVARKSVLARLALTGDWNFRSERGAYVNFKSTTTSLFTFLDSAKMC